VKVEKKFKVYNTVRKINKRVEERRKRWKKFGRSAGTVGPEPGITKIAEEVHLVLGEEERKERELAERLKKGQETVEGMFRSFVSQNRPGQGPTSGPAASTPGKWQSKRAMQASSGPQVPSALSNTTAPSVPSDRYIPPNRLNKDDVPTLRVTNLSEDITLEELVELFEPFGPIYRTFLAKDKATNKSKGFAFVNYKNRKDAQAAMDALNGKGWNYIILSVEWAKPSAPS